MTADNLRDPRLSEAYAAKCDMDSAEQRLADLGTDYAGFGGVGHQIDEAKDDWCAASRRFEASLAKLDGTLRELAEDDDFTFGADELSRAVNGRAA